MIQLKTEVNEERILSSLWGCSAFPNKVEGQGGQRGTIIEHVIGNFVVSAQGNIRLYRA